MKVALLVGWLMVDTAVALYYDFAFDNTVATETGGVRAMDDTWPPPPPPPDWP